MPEANTRSRRSFGPTVLAGLAGAVLASVAGAKDWARASGASAGTKVDAAAKGSESAPLVTALALVALAAWGVVLVSRGRVRQAVSAVGMLASVGVLVATAVAFNGAKDDALRVLNGKGVDVDTSQVTLTGWYFAAGVGATVAVVAFFFAVLKSRGWPSMGTKYDAPGARAEQPVNEHDMWRALDEGHDPTS
jgi:uncharacterized membrane protein (TIGR02234 family)